MADKTATETSTNEEVNNVEDFGDVSWDEGEQVEDKTLDSKGKIVPASTDDDEEAEDSEEDVESTGKADKTDEETESEEATDEDQPTEDKETETEVETTEDSTDTEDKDTMSPEERKRHNDEMAKARIAERDAKQKARDAEKQAENATIERYLREAGDDQAELERRQLNVEAYRVKQEKIQVNEEKLEAGIQRAVAQIPLFKTGSKAVQEELAASLDDFERMYVKKDPETGKPVEVLGNVFDFLQNKASSISRIRSDGATLQGKAKSKEKSRTITPPVRAPKKAKEDPVMAGFDDEAARY